ncbi:MAG: S8 family serine peptidase [Lachnotalea sp.]
MKKIKQYIAIMLIFIVSISLVAPVSVQAGSIPISNVTKNENNADVIDSNQTVITSEGTDSTSMANILDTTEDTNVIDSTDTTEVTDVTEAIDTTEATDVEEATDTAEVTDATEATDVTEATNETEATDTAEVTDMEEEITQEEDKIKTDPETEDSQEIIEMTTNELSETVSDLYEDTDLDSTVTYATKTLIVISENSDFENYDASKIINYDTMYILQYDTEDATKNAYKKLKKDDDIISVEIDAIIESQTEINIETTESSKEKSDFAFYLDSKEKNSDVTVAILDSGIDLLNELFQDRIIDLNINLSVTGNENSIEDDNGHGTEMAKIIVNNTPNTVKIMPIKIANDSGKATVLNAYLGIKLAIENNADIINISMGTVSSNSSIILSNIIEEAVSKGILVVAASGNDNANVENYTPANIDSVITVSATDNSGVITSFSNYGDKIDYSSYGEGGTSSAAANVSAIIAIVKSIYPDYSLDDINNLLKEYALDFGEEGFDQYYGNGFIGLESVDEEISETEKEDNSIFNYSDWKNLSEDEFNKIVFNSEQYMVGKFLSELDEEDFNLALSKSEYLNNTTVISTFDDDGNISGQEKEICYKYCLKEYEMEKNELQTYNNTKFAAKSATVYINLKATDGAFTSSNKVTIKGESNKDLKKYTVWVSGGSALTGLTMTATPEHTGGTDLGFAIASDAWSFGIYLNGIDDYKKTDDIRQAGVVFQIKYNKPAGYQLSSVTGSYPKAMFSGLELNGEGHSNTTSAPLWQYGSNDNAAYNTGTDNKNSTTKFNKSTPNIWIAGNLQKIISSSPILTITYEPIKYLQRVKARYENADASYGDYVDDVSVEYSYGSTFSWSKEENSVYQANSIDSYTVTSEITTPVDIIRKSNVSASATVNATPTASGWYKGLPQISFTGSDPNLNISSVTVNSTPNSGASTTITASEGSNTYSYYATNVNNISSGTQDFTIYADNSAPINVSILASTTWTNTTAPLVIAGQDTISGLASLKIQYSSNNYTWNDYQTQTYSGQKELKSYTGFSADQNGYYRVIATDLVGFTTASSSVHVTNIDKSAPSLTYTIAGTYLNGWYKGSAVLNLTAGDTGGSGVKSITVNNNEASGSTRAINVTSEGSNLYICNATDHAENKTIPNKVITIQVDASVPVNLGMTPNTLKWTNAPVKITVKADDVQSGIQYIELQYTVDKDNPDWKSYQTVTMNGVNQASTEISVTDNGYYRLIVTDRVGYQTTTENGNILKIDNYDPVEPDYNTIGIVPDTRQWVNEPTGVEVTSYGSDELSGLSTVDVLERNESGNFESIKTEQYNGETTVEPATYDTHINGNYKTKITDQAGNNLIMPDEEALEVDNIDSEAPDLTITSVSPEEDFISTKEGYVIRAVIEDSQSGFAEAALQKLNEDGEWEDYKAQYQVITEIKEDADLDNSEAEEAELTKVPRERYIVATANQTLISNMETEEIQLQSEGNEVKKQGDTQVIIDYTIRENGTYRLKGTDLVENTAYTNHTIEINNLDGSMPAIQVEGNPTIWQNTDATIKVIAMDADSEIVKMTLDGEEEALTEENGAFYFTYDATKNQDFTVTATDEAGNTTTQVINVTKIDKDAPDIDTTIKNTWVSMILNDYRNLNIDTSDALSGICKISVTFEDQETVLKEYAYEKAKDTYQENYKIYKDGSYIITATDQAGNITTQTIAEGNLDFSAPWLKIEGNPTIWQNTDATITVTAYDEDSEITKMILDGIEQNFSKNEDGEYVFSFVATKNQDFLVAAYDESKMVTATKVKVTKIDKEFPTISTELALAWSDDGYRNMNFFGAETLSGIKEIYIEHGGIKETLSSFDYETAQMNASNDYHIMSNGDYVISIQDHAGNINTQVFTETGAKILKAIEVVIQPDKTIYYETENFKKKGMIVDAIYMDNSRKDDIKDYIILDGINLPLAQDTINLSYTKDGVTVYTDTPITVIEKGEGVISPQSDDPVIPDTPVSPSDPVAPDIPDDSVTTEDSITPVIAKEIEDKISVFSEKQDKDETLVTSQIENNENQLLGGLIFGVAGLFVIILFMLLANVKIYSKNEDGEWKFLGKTRALRSKEQYGIKISKFLRIRASSNRYKLEFSKMFKKFHEECDLLIKIDQEDYEKHLEKDSDTVYVDQQEL